MPSMTAGHHLFAAQSPRRLAQSPFPPIPLKTSYQTQLSSVAYLLHLKDLRRPPLRRLSPFAATLTRSLPNHCICSTLSPLSITLTHSFSVSPVDATLTRLRGVGGIPGLLLTSQRIGSQAKDVTVSFDFAQGEKGGATLGRIRDSSPASRVRNDNRRKGGDDADEDATLKGGATLGRRGE